MINWLKVRLRSMALWFILIVIIIAVIVALIINWGKVQLGSLAQWLSAIGTITAVIIALFKEQILSSWRRPELTVRARQSPPDIDHITFRYPTNIPPPGHLPLYGSAGCYFLRLWIQNEGNPKRL
jgi:hypothetical protein